MEILYLLVPIAALLAVLIAVAFVWAIRSGQFEDLEGPAHRILMDDDDELIPRDARSQPADSGESPAQSKPARQHGEPRQK